MNHTNEGDKLITPRQERGLSPAKNPKKASKAKSQKLPFNVRDIASRVPNTKRSNI
jgi:hypothetical protein